MIVLDDSCVVFDANSDEIISVCIGDEMVEIFTNFIFFEFSVKSCKDERLQREQWEIRVQLLDKRCLVCNVLQLFTL